MSEHVSFESSHLREVLAERVGMDLSHTISWNVEMDGSGEVVRWECAARMPSGFMNEVLDEARRRDGLGS